MKDEELQTILDSIKEKIGDESYGLISDKVGELYTLNKSVNETIVNYENEITRLKDTNSKLVESNGALLQQIPKITKEPEEPKNSEPKYFDYHEAFDENGNFK